MREIYLKSRQAGSAIGRHPWVFSSAIVLNKEKPENGEIVSVLKQENHQFVAYGVYNKESEIRVRLYSWDSKVIPDETWIRAKIESAYRFRKDVLHLNSAEQAFRLIHSEGDGISGLTVDQYNDILVVQATSFWIHENLEKIVSILVDVVRPKGIWLKKASPKILEKEGINQIDKVLYGEVPPTVQFQQGSLVFQCQLKEGQKTGSFLDQRVNQRIVSSYAYGREVLDLYCHLGGFALDCAKRGASRVVAVDSSAPIIEMGRFNSKRNQLPSVEWVEQDAFVYLKSQAPQSFSMVISDPPKFAPTIRDKERALQKYFRLNVEALRVLKSEGIFVTCSCSGVVRTEDWVRLVASAAKKAKVFLRILEIRGAAADHPVNPDCPETEYLKCLIAEIRK